MLAIHDVGAKEDNPIVLIGAESLLVAPFRTKGKPGPIDTDKVVALEVELDDAARQCVVECRDELRNLLGANTLRKHVERQLAYVVTGLQQHVDIGRRVDCLTDLAQTDALQRKQITLGNHPLQASALVYRQDMANAVHGQRQRGVVGRRRQRQRMRMRRHDRFDRLVERGTRQDDALEHIGLSKDADRPLLVIDNDHRTYRARCHHLDNATHRCSTSHRNRRPFDDRGERRVHCLLFGDTLRKLRLQLLARLAEQTGDVLRAKEVEDHTLLQE